jgi:hypothetical protein
MSQPDFSARMATVPVEELVRIAFSNSADGFLPEAIAAAKLELDRRGVVAEESSQILEQIRSDPEELENRKFQRLGVGGRILAFIGGMSGGLALFFIWSIFKTGYRQKGIDAIKWALAGLCILMILSIAIAVSAHQ